MTYFSLGTDYCRDIRAVGAVPNEEEPPLLAQPQVTDKAADLTSVLGTTKRLAERLTAWYGVA